MKSRVAEQLKTAHIKNFRIELNEPAEREDGSVFSDHDVRAVLLGKVNLHELAMGVTTVNEHFGPSRNPHDPYRVAGGSSGGSVSSLARSRQTSAPMPASKRTMLTSDQTTFAPLGRLSISGSCGQLFV